MMRLCHGLLDWKEKKIGCNIFTAAGTLSPGALKSSLKQSVSQQNPSLNASLSLGERDLTT